MGRFPGLSTLLAALAASALIIAPQALGSPAGNRERGQTQTATTPPILPSEFAGEGIRGIVYILPSECCTSYWTEEYGDRIYFYVYANLSDCRRPIGSDFSLMGRYYNTVIVIIPADDSPLFRHNLRVIDDLAEERSMRVIWGVFPKWKCGPEDDYLEPGTPMNGLVLGLMEFLSTLNSTWKVAIWYGWSYRRDYADIIRFYDSLPEALKGVYAAWLDEEFAPLVNQLAGVGPEFLVITELYSEDEIAKFSGTLPNQMVVTGYEGAGDVEEWLSGICPNLRSVRNPSLVGVWMFYDRGDGSGEDYGAYFPGEGLADPWRCLSGVRRSSHPPARIPVTRVVGRIIIPT